MKIKIIGCESTKDQVLDIKPNVDATFLPFGLHATPSKLNNELQRQINLNQQYDFIVLTYGRCGNATVGLISPEVPLLLPKTHDCIGLLLGGKTKRAKVEKSYPTSYFLSDGWLKYGTDPLTEYHNYLEKYDKATTEYLIKSLYGNYTNCIYIGQSPIPRRVLDLCKETRWSVTTMTPNYNLLHDLLHGNITDDTVYVPANTKIQSKMLA